MRAAEKSIYGLLSAGVLSATVGCEFSADYQILGPGEVTQNVPEPPPSPRQLQFEKLDADGDGQLTESEFSTGRKAEEASGWFKKRDVDHDGLVSLEEFLPAVPIGYVEAKKPAK